MIETLSNSKVQMLSRCPRQFYYRYILGYKIPPNSFRNFGGAYHSTMEANFKYKMDSGEDMPVEQVKDIFTDEWKRASDEVEWEYEEEREENFSDRGVDLVGNYIKDVAPNRNPTYVEYEFSVALPEIDLPFVGVIDLVLDSNHISDHKTATRRWNKYRAHSELQPTAYYLAFEEDFGTVPEGFIYDIAPRTGKSEIQIVETSREEIEKIEYLGRLKSLEECVAKEVYPKTDPGNWLCSEKWCGYYGHCIKGIPLRQLRLQAREDAF
jgi:CRISPR/Cas system-associated exonuclease Cas4 (RecB family)